MKDLIRDVVDILGVFLACFTVCAGFFFVFYFQGLI